MLITQDDKAFEVSKKNQGILRGNIHVKEMYAIPQKINAAYRTNFGSESGSYYDIIFTDEGNAFNIILVRITLHIIKISARLTLHIS